MVIGIMCTTAKLCCFLQIVNATEVKLNYTSDTHCALQLVGGKHMKDEGMKGITFHRTEFDYILICILLLSKFNMCGLYLGVL